MNVHISELKAHVEIVERENEELRYCVKRVIEAGKDLYKLIDPFLNDHDICLRWRAITDECQKKVEKKNE